MWLRCAATEALQMIEPPPCRRITSPASRMENRTLASSRSIAWS